MASCMSSLTIHYFELNWKSFICSCSCGRSADPTACIQTRTWRRIRYLYKWFSGIQLLLWHYFFFFPLLISASQLWLSPEKQRKACFAPCAPANSAWTSSIIRRGCYFPSLFVQSLHASHATRSSSSGPWWLTGELILFLSSPLGVSLGLAGSPEGREASSCLLCCCSFDVLTWGCSSVSAQWQKGNEREGVQYPASPLQLTAQNCSCGSYSYHPIPAL